MTRADQQLTAQARTAFDANEWAECCSAYTDAQVAGETFAAQDLEQRGLASYWTGDAAGAIADLERASDACAQIGDRDAEARASLLTARVANLTGQDTIAAVHFGRVGELLAEASESPIQAVFQWSLADLTSRVDEAAGRPLFEAALAMARRVEDATAEALALTGLARLDVHDGAVEVGLRRTSAAAALALGGEVETIAAGGVLCSAIWVHRDAGDWKGAAEWTDAALRWTERAKVAMYPGLCRFHRCEVLRVQGELDAALVDAEEACEELDRLNRPIAGYGYRELGEIRLRGGDDSGAEGAFSAALEHGVDPNPGLARLRLARGQAVSARRGLEDALAAPNDTARGDRPFLLPVLVAACLADDDVDAARAASVMLDDLAEQYDTEAHRAAAHQARADVALVEGRLADARSAARLAWQGWVSVNLPHDAAIALETLGQIALAVGEREEGLLDLRTAHAAFERIGSTHEAMRIASRLAELEGPPDSARGERAFMFTDIVDSTRLQSLLGDAKWMQLLAWHDRTLREVFTAHSGEVVKHEGDGFFVAFPTGRDALRCGCQAQQVFARHRDGAGFAPDVRIGVHEGEALQRDGDWFGHAVTKTSRVAAEGSGGDVLCTDAVLASAPEAEIARTTSVTLKGIDEPIAIHVVNACA